MGWREAGERAKETDKERCREHDQESMGAWKPSGENFQNMGIVESLKFRKRPSQLKIEESTELSNASVRKLVLVIGSVWWAEG